MLPANEANPENTDIKVIPMSSLNVGGKKFLWTHISLTQEYSSAQSA